MKFRRRTGLDLLSGYALPSSQPLYGKKPLKPGRKTLIEPRELFRRTQPALSIESMGTGVIEGDRYPHAPRLDPLRAALARLEAAAEPTAQPKAPPPAQADKRR
jgi:hypothetical protein